jgi:hypothetical protein
MVLPRIKGITHSVTEKNGGNKGFLGEIGKRQHRLDMSQRNAVGLIWLLILIQDS